MVRLDDDVHEALTKLVAKNESYSKIIRRLIDANKGNKK
jgi:predicted CopG family antitoxin